MTKVDINFGKQIGKHTVWFRSRDTRSGFAHDCAVPALRFKCSAHYLNRTWEEYCFQSVAFDMADKVVRNVMGLNPKTKNGKAAYEKAYANLKRTIDRAHAKGKFRYLASENVIFG